MLKIREGFHVGQIILDENQLRKAKNFYEVAMKQQYICENYEVDEETALKIAELSHDIQKEAYDDAYNVEEEESIYEACEELGIHLKEREEEER